MGIGILGAILFLGSGRVCAQRDDGSTRWPGVPAIHYRETDADREARRNPPPPRFITPTTPPSYQNQHPYQTYPQLPYYPQPRYQPSYPPGGFLPQQPQAPERFRPRRPPEFVDFSDEFTDIVTRFVDSQAKKNQGLFVVKDDQDARYHYLKLARVLRDSIMRLSPTEVFGCVEFDGVAGSSGKYDLDFYLSNEDWEWKVSKLLIHKVNAQARFHYNSEHEIVVRNAPAAGAPGLTGGAPGQAAVPKPKAPAQLQAAVAFRDPSGANVLSGESRAELMVTVANAGPGPAYAVRIVPALQGDVPGLRMPAEVAVGDIPAGKSAAAAVPLTGSPDLRSQQARIQLSVNEGNGFDADPLIVEFRTKAAKPPRIEIAGVKIGGGGVVRAGESTPVAVTVRNSGGGAAEAVKAVLETGSADIFLSGEPAVELGALQAGQSKAAEFEFFVKKRYRGTGLLPVSVTVSEAKGRYGLPSQPLNLALGRGAPAAQIFGVPAGAAELEEVDAPPAARTPANPQAYAVVVGIEKYRDIPAVEFAARDAQAVCDYLTGAMGFDPKNVVHLENERATRTDLTTYLGPWLKDRVTAQSRVFVYFSGHGAPNPVTGESYLIPYDGNPNYVETKAFALKQLYDNLAQLPTRDVTVVLDSCFSGAGGRSFLAAGIRPLVNVKVAAPAENMVVISAAQGAQISTYYPEAQHGMFTYFLLKGLRGAADSDHSGAITTRKLFEYLRPEVEREARKQHVEQSPDIAPPLDDLGGRAGRVWLKLK